MNPGGKTGARAPVLADAVRVHQSGDLEAAEQLYQTLLIANPDNADVLTKIGLLNLQKKDFQHAKELLERALVLAPANPEAMLWYGEVLRQSGDPTSAVAMLRKVVDVAPELAPAWFNLGLAEQAAGNLAAARAAWERFAQVRPRDARVWAELGHLAFNQGDYAQAATAYEQQALRAPEDANAYFNAGLACERLAQLDRALAWYHNALALSPDRGDVHNALGVAQFNLANHDLAIEHYEKALALDPGSRDAQSNLLMALHHVYPVDPDRLIREHLASATRHADIEPTPIAAFENDRDPDRPLRIGYVSPRFCEGPLEHFFLPLLANHDREVVNAVCYATSTMRDRATIEMQNAAAAWREVDGVSDEAFARMVRDDRIDILVDLVGHCPGNSLRMFARRAAPVQMTWMDYVDTTGVRAMDYIVSDALHTPPGGPQQFTERVLRLPATRMVYRAARPLPPVASPPALAHGYVTFGCFNRLSKFGPIVVETWSRILTSVPRSRLVLKATAFASEATCRQVHARFAQYGIDPARIELRSYSSELQMLAEYADVDVALDPFPYNGCTTTCDALTMGVPVVTLAGPVLSARHGVALLTNCGLTDWITRSLDEYVERARIAALDTERLAQLRRVLRSQMLASALADGPRFACAFEDIYRHVWRMHCERVGE